MSTEQQFLKEAMTVMSRDIDDVDLLGAVLVDVERHRRRRRLWIGGAVLAAAAATVAGVIALAPSNRSAEPAVPPAPVSVVLNPSATDSVDRPTIAVMTDNGMVWVLDDEGNQHMVTTTDIAAVFGITLSDDGRRLVVSGTTGGEWKISVIDTQQAQRGVTQVVELASQTAPEGGRAFRPAMSPDGSLVAFATSYSFGALVAVQLLPTDGSESGLLLLNDDDWYSSGLMSPVAFSSHGDRLLVYPGNVGILDVSGALRGDPTPTVPTAEVPFPYDYTQGWDASADLSQILVASPGVSSDDRRWAFVDTATGEIDREIVRPAADELQAWRADGSLLWAHESTRGVNAYDFVTGDDLTMVITPPAEQELVYGAFAN